LGDTSVFSFAGSLLNNGEKNKLNLHISKSSSIFVAMKKDIVIIGLGVIAHYHVAALRQSERFRLCGLCDILPQTAEDELFRGVPFFTDYTTMLSTLHPDYALIATPPATHYAIAKQCIEQGVTPIVEKPLSDTAEQGMQFFSSALRGRYIAVCHTLYGEEVLWFISHLPMTNVTAIYTELYDPYCAPDGQILERFRPLGGCWLDSAPNALAPLLTHVLELTQIHVSHQRDQYGMPFASHLTATAGAATIEMRIAWNKGINYKRTRIEADGKEILLDHSKQAVYVDGRLLFQATTDRLTQQYANFYRLFPKRVPTEQSLKYIYEIIYSNL